jgi:acetoin utilization deacetylase AcuC-like enzyme
MAAAPVFLHHPSSLEHDTGPHPERAERIVAIERSLEAAGWLGFERMLSSPVSFEVLGRVHPEAYVASLSRVSASGGGSLDPDTVLSSGSYVAALHAAGGAVELVDLLLDGSAPCGFSAHRPPGHHALPARAMGFGLFNNVAVAARHAVRGRGLERVMVLDWDVHHGNGTNDIFHADPSVLFVSIHEYPMYPGTGAASDTGSGAGEGFTVNLPVPAGSGDEVYVSLVSHVAVPLALAFQPQLLLISAGFDAHRDDPLARCEVTDGGFAAMSALVARVALELGIPVGAVLEGGYDLGALSRSVVAMLGALGDSDGGAGLAASASASPGGAVAVAPIAAAARARLAERWPTLAA